MTAKEIIEACKRVGVPGELHGHFATHLQPVCEELQKMSTETPQAETPSGDEVKE